MKILSLLLIGFFTLMPLQHVGAQTSADEVGPDLSNLYQRVLSRVRADLLPDRTEGPVQGFVSRALGNDEEDNQPLVKPEQVDLYLQDIYQDACAGRDRPVGFSECEQLANNQVTSLVFPLKEHRALARELQSIATTFEQGMTGVSSSTITLPLKLESIVSIWQSGTDQFFDASPGGTLRFASITDEEDRGFINSLIERVGRALPDTQSAEGPDGEKTDISLREAAVWRYRDGVEQALRLGNCEDEDASGNGTQLQFTNDSWRLCDLEDALSELLEGLRALLQEEYDLDTVTVLLPPKELDSNLGAVAWLRSDDVGLDFSFPLSPVLPSLDCSQSQADRGNVECQDDGTILGGLYPAAPIEPELDTGLCSHPLAARGYLCRAIEILADCEPEGAPRGGDDIQITLTTCRTPPLADDVAARRTYSGPDICRYGAWRSEPEVFDAETIFSPQCTNCQVQFVCEATCRPGDGPKGETRERTDDGLIEVCLPSRAPAAALLPLAIHEMVHVQQACSQSQEIGKKIADDCCQTEYPGYYSQCVALARDGILDGLDITPEDCAAATADLACDEKCSTFGDDEIDDKTDAIIDAINTAPDPGFTCGELVNDLNTYVQGRSDGADLDGRLRSMLLSLSDSCNPECAAAYDSTIGNNLCYAGQCIEEGIEQHRLVPGRIPLTGQNQAYPFDACVAPPPAPEEAGTLPTSPSINLPDYNPALLARTLDIALCQQSGLPPLTPPVLCGRDTARRFGLEIPDYLSLSSSLTDQSNEAEQPTQALRDDSALAGHRLGARLLTEQIAEPWTYLGKLIDSISDQLDQITDTSFPTAMCPQSTMFNLCSDLSEKRTDFES